VTSRSRSIEKTFTSQPPDDRRCTLALTFSIIACGVALSQTAAAQATSDSVTAQALFDDARELMSRGQYAQACPKLEESQRLDPGSGTLLNLGACYEQQGRIASAWSMFLDAAAAAHSTGNAGRANAARERAARLAPRLARILIRVTTDTPAGLEVRRDDRIVGSVQWGTAIPADPGVHMLSAVAPGKTPWRSTITLQEGVTTTVVIPDLAAVNAPVTGGSATTRGAAPTALKSENAAGAASAERFSTSGLGAQRIAAIATGGVGLAGVVTGTIFFLQSKSKHDQSQLHCTGAECNDETGMDLSHEALRAGNVATVAYTIGTVGLAAGAILWFTAPRVAPQVGVERGMVRVRVVW
jgi:hypothetical protein